LSEPIDFFRRQNAPTPWRHGPERQWAECDACERCDVVPNGGKHPSHLMVPAFMNRQFREPITYDQQIGRLERRGLALQAQGSTSK
jgi:hypothetical protein